MLDNREVITKAYNLSAKHIEMQFIAINSADQRAMKISGSIVVAAAVLCALAKDTNVPIAMLLGSIFLVLSAFLAWYSASPQSFYIPGANYSDLKKDIKDNTHMCILLAELGKYNDIHIRANNVSLRKNNNLMRFSFRAAILGFLIAIIPQIIAAF